MRLRRQGLCSSCPSQPRPAPVSPFSPSRRVLLLRCPPLHPLDPPTVGAALLNLFVASLSFYSLPPYPMLTPEVRGGCGGALFVR